MELKTFFAQDETGQVIPGAAAHVYLPGTTVLATGLKDRQGNVLTNPFTADGNGQIQFVAPNGHYDLHISFGERVYSVPVKFLDVEDTGTLGIETASGQQTLRNALDQRVLYVESIAGLQGVSPLLLRDGQQVTVLSYHTPLYPSTRFKGGGTFAWDSTRAKADHDGALIISPTVPTIAEQTGRTTEERMAAFRVGDGESDPNGIGCFIRTAIEKYDVAYFGALTGNCDNHGPIQAALNVTTPGYERAIVTLSGETYSVSSQQLVIDSSKVALHGDGGVLSFTDHVGDVDCFIRFTNMHDLASTYSNPLCTIRDIAFVGKGKNVTKNNNGIVIDTNIGGTVATAGASFQGVQIRDMHCAITHLQSSYNLTWISCSIHSNATGISYIDDVDMFERSVFVSCNVFNNGLGIFVGARNGQVYLNNCSLDYNDIHIEATHGGIELHGCHVEGTLRDQPHFKVSHLAAFYATGGWWQFRPEEGYTAQEEFSAAGAIPGVIVIENVKFSSFGGPAFTLNPELVRVINPRPDSESSLSLNRFRWHNTLPSGLFEMGVVGLDAWLTTPGTPTSRYEVEGGSLSVVTDDAINAYSGSAYLKLSKTYGTGAGVNITVAVALHTNCRRANISIRAKTLSASGSIRLRVGYAALSPSASGATPYETLHSATKGETSLTTLTNEYQKLWTNFGATVAEAGYTHALLTIDTFDLGPGDIALDDISIAVI
ncbi:hypothetical protein GCM10027040_21050 [Halomonas shantousis]